MERARPGRLAWAWWGLVALIAVVTVRDLAAPSQCDTTYVWEGYEAVDVASVTGSARRYSLVRYKDGPAEGHAGEGAGPGSPARRCGLVITVHAARCGRTKRHPSCRRHPNGRSLAARRGGRDGAARRGGVCARAPGQPQAGPLPGFGVGARTDQALGTGPRPDSAAVVGPGFRGRGQRAGPDAFGEGVQDPLPRWPRTGGARGVLAWGW